MTTAEFINLFKTGKLGKKRTHSGYRVMDGDHCQLLVRSTRRYRAPSGSELLGIYFGNNICIFHNNFSGIRSSVTKDVVGSKPILSNNVLDQDDQSLIDSGIIEVDEDRQLMLVEIGETPWLFEFDPSYCGKFGGWDYNTGSQITKRVATIAEAEKDVALGEHHIDRLGRLLEVMPSDFVPVATSEKDHEILKHPPNPFHYGFSLEDCTGPAAYSRNGTGCGPLYLRSKAAASNAAIPFKEAVQEYAYALERFIERAPPCWNELTHSESGTILVAEGGNVYIKGHISHRYNSSEEHDFDTWNKILGESKKIRLAAR